MSVSVVPVRSAADLNRFIKMVWPLYQGDPNWVPPLVADRKKLLDRKRNPFYQHAQMELFLAEQDGRAVGRIAAIINHAHNTTHNDTVGFFGFFESIDDQQVANALLNAAGEWLASHGMTTMRGPVNPSLNDEAGLLTEGFDDPPQILMTYNPKYYIRLIESYGLRPVKVLYAYQLRGETFLDPKLERVAERVRQRQGITIRQVNFKPKTAFLKDVAILKDIYNQAWEQNWGFVRMTDAEFDFLAADLKQVANPDFAIIAQIGDRPVGFALGLPDINQLLIANRRGGLLGAAYRLTFHKKKISRGRILVLGVIPEFRGLGLDGVLYRELGTRMVAAGCAEGEASWVLEDNVMMNRAARMMHGEVYKKYCIYDKTLTKN